MTFNRSTISLLLYISRSNLYLRLSIFSAVYFIISTYLFHSCLFAADAAGIGVHGRRLYNHNENQIFAKRDHTPRKSVVLGAAEPPPSTDENKGTTPTEPVISANSTAPAPSIGGYDYTSDPFVVKVHTEFWKLPEDNNTYLALDLENGMSIRFISSPSINLGGAAIGFDCGFFNDPFNLQGLAHFHEHMVQMGTSKYPGMQSFREFIAMGGGFGNAQTQSSSTLYWDRMEDDHLIDLVKRYRDFFQNPSFPIDAFQNEIRAIQSELVGRRMDYSVMVSLLNVVVNRDNYAQKMGVGHEKIVERVAQKGYENVRAHLAVFQARYYLAQKATMAFVTRKPFYPYIKQVIDIFRDLRTTQASTVEDMQSYIDSAHLVKAEVRAALDEHINDPFPMTRELSVKSPINYTSLGTELRLALPSAANTEFSFVFPCEDIGTIFYNSSSFFVHSIFTSMKSAFRLLSFDVNQYPMIFTIDRSYENRRNFVLLKFITNTPDFPMENMLRIGETVFEYVGNALRQPPDLLEALVRNSTRKYDMRVRPPTVNESFITSAAGRRTKHEPIEQVTREAVAPHFGWNWNFTYIMDAVKRFIQPQTLVLHVVRPEFDKQAAQNPHEWTTIESWTINYQTRKLSDEVLERFQRAYEKGLSGESFYGPPVKKLAVVRMGMKQKPAIEAPSGTRIRGAEEYEVQKLLAELKVHNMTVNMKSFNEFPEYLEVNLGHKRNVQLYHEHSTALRASAAVLMFTLEVPVAAVSARAQLLLQMILNYIKFLTPQSTPPVFQSTASVSGGLAPYIFVNLVGTAYSVLTTFSLFLKQLGQVLETGVFNFVDSDWKTARQVFQTRLKTQADIYTHGILASHVLGFPLVLHGAVDESKAFNTTEYKSQFVQGLSLLRTAVSTSNPQLILLGDVLRTEAVDLCRTIGENIPFHNIPRKWPATNRAAVWNNPLQRIVLKDLNTEPDVDYAYFVPLIQVTYEEDPKCLKSVIRDMFLHLFTRNINPYFRTEKGMCYTSHYAFMNTDLLSGQRVVSGVVVSNSHTAYEMALVYQDFKKYLRNYIVTASDKKLHGLLQLHKKETVDNLAQPMTFLLWKAAMLIDFNYDILRPFYCGIQTVKLAANIKKFRSELLGFFDEWNSSSSNPTANEAFALIEREERLKTIGKRTNLTETSITCWKPQMDNKGERGEITATKQTAPDPLDSTAPARSVPWKPMACLNAAECTWLASVVKLHPQPVAFYASKTKELYRSTHRKF